MKRYLIVIAFLLIPCLVFAQGMQPCGGVTVSGKSCTGATNQGDATCQTVLDYLNVAVNAATIYWSGRIQYGGTEGVLCRIDTYLKKTCATTCTGNVVIKLYSDDGGGTPHPQNLLSTCTAKAIDSLQTTAQWETFSNCDNAVTITNGTYYWISINKDAAADASNYASIGQDATCAIMRVDYSSDGSSWSNLLTNRGLLHKIYIKE